MADRMMEAFRYYAADHPVVSGFKWEEGVTAGATWGFVGSQVAIYFVAILTVKLLAHSGMSPFSARLLPLCHNFILLVTSVVIFSGALQATLVELKQSRWLWESDKTMPNWLLCFPPETRTAGRIFFWTYVYYVSKYVELLDTLIIVLRKRKLTLFHVLQHAGNLVMVFSWLHYAQSVQVISLLTNTLIQIPLYAYFFFSSLGYDPPGKKLVTLLQIMQFVVSLGAAGVMFSWVFDHGVKCSGVNACLANAGFNLVLMLLLVNYYVQVYVKKKPYDKGGRKAVKKAE